jgi:uncharacterized membrane protein YuzA (DUF378 family)
MVMTQLTLVFLGALATLATLGLFVEFDDRWTSILVEFLAAILWGLFGMSAFDVIVTEHVSPPVSEPILPLAYLGIGLAFIVALYGFYDLIQGFGAEASEADMDLLP